MLTREQAPLKRVAAKQAFKKGLITSNQYRAILDELDRYEKEQKIADEKRIKIARSKLHKLIG